MNPLERVFPMAKEKTLMRRMAEHLRKLVVEKQSDPT